ncbi:MAG: phosphonate transport system substrate-binding protein [Glaciecola sp.]|jgi:phosphonate transport system substrate-binding protein
MVINEAGESVQDQLDPSKPLPETVDIVFGVYKTDKATELYRKFLPVIEAVQADLTERLDCDVNIELQIFGTYEEGLSALVAGKVDFVRFGPTSYILAKGQNDAIALLARESKKGESTFKGVICVKVGSPYQTLEDLRGCRFAFGNPNSTIGRFLAQEELLKVGIKSSDLGTFEYLAQHDRVGKAVMLGDFDAGALKESTFNKLNAGAALRKLHTFDNITKPWIASAKLHPKLKEGLSAALFNLKDPAALKSLKVTGFLKATDSDYQPVRFTMERVLAEFEDPVDKVSSAVATP